MRNLISSAIIVCLLGCSSVQLERQQPDLVIREFTAAGFPERTVQDVWNLFPEALHDDMLGLGPVPYWRSSRNTEVVYFESEPCNYLGTGLVHTVHVTCRRSSASAAMSQLRAWLRVANPALSLPPDLASPSSQTDFEATWSVEGRQVQVRAWVHQKESYWLGVFNIYRNPGVMVSAAQPNPGMQRTRYARR